MYIPELLQVKHKFIAIFVKFIIIYHKIYSIFLGLYRKQLTFIQTMMIMELLIVYCAPK